MRGAIAASLLQRAGYEVVNMSGGFEAWQRASLPVVANSVPCASGACSST
jgi:rhodanese-related sulfurtransferase